MVALFKAQGEETHYTIHHEKGLNQLSLMLADLLLRHRPGTGVPSASNRVQNEEFHRVLANGEVEMLFQPIVSLWTGGIAGYEALARGPEGSSLREAVPLFSRAKSKRDRRQLALLCVRGALESLRTQNRSLRDGKLLCINIDPNIASAAELRDAFDEHRNWVRPWDVVLEITEQPADAGRLLDDMKDLIGQGFSLAADDQGTGGANVQRMTEMKPRFIKTPYETALGINDKAVQRIVESYVDVARLNGGSVIAEGVDSAERLRCFSRLGIRLVQGFGLGKPTHDLSPNPVMDDEMAAALRSVVEA